MRKILADVKMRNKLLLLLTLPFLAILFFGIVAIKNNYDDLKNVRLQNSLITLMSKLDDVNDAIRDEGNSSANFLFNPTTTTSNELQQARENADNSIVALREARGNDPINDIQIRAFIINLFEKLDALGERRNRIDTKSISVEDAKILFFNLSNDVYGEIVVIAHKIPLKSFAESILSYLQMMKVIQYNEDEVALLKRFQVEKQIDPKQFNEFLFLDRFQEIYFSFFNQLASPEVKELFKSSVKSQFTTDTSKLIDSISNNNPDKIQLIESRIAGLRVKLDALKDFKEKLINLNEEKGKAIIKDAAIHLFLIITIILAIILISILLAAIIVKGITQPLENAVKIAEQVSDGNLIGIKEPSRRLDEMGELERALYKMVQNLQVLTKNLQEEINVLTASTAEILNSISEVSSGTQETAAAVTETTTTIEELKQTGQISADKATDVLSTGEDALKIIKDNEKSLEATIKDMHLIQERMSTISESIIKLSEHSQTISKIIDTVNDLAEQSNLLAVNAAIEAAKAGEQGKGFAVVAQEVRNLAEQSKQATVQVHKILQDIQNATSSAVMATEQGAKAVAKGVDESSQASESIKSLYLGISNVAKAANQISITSRQQLAGVGQVTAAMTNIKEASDHHVIHMKQIQTAVHDLNSVGLSLKNMAEQYKL